MADFYPVLSRAIAGLSENTPEARRAVYDRATAVLVTQLRGMNPPVSETDIARQRLALQEAITRIEREQALPDFDEPSLGAAEPQREPIRETAREPLQEASGQPRDASSTTARALPEPVSSRLGEDDSDPSEPERIAGATAAPFAAAPTGAITSSGHAAGRPRLDIARERPRRRLPWRAAVVAGGVALVVGAIAVTAYTINQTPGPTAPAPAQPAPPPQATPGGKIGERVGEGGPAQQAPAPPPAAQPAPIPTQPAQPAQTLPGSTPQTPSGGLAVAQRAVVYIEPTDASQPPRAVQGRVTWRVESGGATQGRRIETVLRADVDISEIGLSLVFTIRRNEDAAFPASHIVGMRFTRGSDDGNGAVREAGVPQFKTEENERGAPLAGITSALGENLFVTALSRVDVELNRNLDVMRTRNWIDIPIRFASGRRAIIAFEKGVSGEQRMAEAMRAWQP